ncbi:MAG: DNA topoisomerase, partial [Myxococcota bacterium]
MTIAVVAEKPSVARDIARVIGASQRGQGLLRGNGYVISWAIGHLVALAAPHQIRAEWKRWSRDRLPMIPSDWPLEVIDQTRDQFDIVCAVLCSRDVDEVICATDAGREGELIFRTLYEASGCRKPVRRLWISSLTEQAIRAGFGNLRPGSDFDCLADAARGRSRADWLVGMNLSRAYTLCQGQNETLSVGRVQTPTLAMLVDRELSIRDFVPEDYKEVQVRFQRVGSTDSADSAGGNDTSNTTDAANTSYTGTFFDPALEGKPSAPRGEDPSITVDRLSRARRLPADGERAERIVERALTGEARVLSVEGRPRRLPPPLLYDLTELQRHANRLFGYSAKRTLEIAQVLYEQKKLISYPRTSSRHLTPDVATELPEIVRAFVGGYEAAAIAEGTAERALNQRFVDAARVTDHHAMIPTSVDPGGVSLTRDESRIYDLVCRRLLSAWHEDHLYFTTQVVTTIVNDAGSD